MGLKYISQRYCHHRCDLFRSFARTQARVCVCMYELIATIAQILLFLLSFFLLFFHNYFWRSFVCVFGKWKIKFLSVLFKTHKFTHSLIHFSRSLMQMCWRIPFRTRSLIWFCVVVISCMYLCVLYFIMLPRLLYRLFVVFVFVVVV